MSDPNYMYLIPFLHFNREHIYRKHRSPQCLLCGEVFDRNEEYREHLHMRSCTPPENGFPTLVIHNGQENAMRSRQGLRGLSEEEKWHRIYLIIFPGAHRPYPSPCKLSTMATLMLKLIGP